MAGIREFVIPGLAVAGANSPGHPSSLLDPRGTRAWPLLLGDSTSDCEPSLDLWIFEELHQELADEIAIIADPKQAISNRVQMIWVNVH